MNHHEEFEKAIRANWPEVDLTRKGNEYASTYARWAFFGWLMAHGKREES